MCTQQNLSIQVKYMENKLLYIFIFLLMWWKVTLSYCECYNLMHYLLFSNKAEDFSPCIFLIMWLYNCSSECTRDTRGIVVSLVLVSMAKGFLWGDSVRSNQKPQDYSFVINVSLSMHGPCLFVVSTLRFFVMGIWQTKAAILCVIPSDWFVLQQAQWDSIKCCFLFPELFNTSYPCSLLYCCCCKSSSELCTDTFFNWCSSSSIRSEFPKILFRKPIFRKTKWYMTQCPGLL